MNVNLEKPAARERQIVEAVYRFEEATVGDVLAAIDDAPSYSAVRAILSTLVQKGVIEYRNVKNKYLYRPVAMTRKNRVAGRIRAILNLNIYRISPGKIGGALFLFVAVGAIMLTAMILPPAKMEKIDEETALAKIAIRNDAPKVTLSGKVLNPDGTPAERVWVVFKTTAIHENPPSFSGEKPSWYPAFSGSTGGTKSRGKFFWKRNGRCECDDLRLLLGNAAKTHFRTDHFCRGNRS